MVLATDALRKAKKNIRRVFTSTDDAKDCEELHRLLSSSSFKALIAFYSGQERNKPYSVTEKDQRVRGLINEVVTDLYIIIEDGFQYGELCNELIDLLTSPHIQGLTECMEEIAIGNFHQPTMLSTSLSEDQSQDDVLYAFPPSLPSINGLAISGPRLKTLPKTDTLNGGHSSSNGNEKRTAILTGGGEGLPMKPTDSSLKIISFLRMIGEDLGITIGLQKSESTQAGYARDVFVKRVMAGSQIERLGLLHEGDIIREVNGVAIDCPETLQEQIAKSPPTVTMKIIPAFKETKLKSQLFVRSLFSYDPAKDAVLPCKEAGLFFHCYDILQIVNQDDSNWWQARRYDTEDHAGLIPSIALQERRTTLVQAIPDSNAFNYRLFKGLVENQRVKKTKVVFKARQAEEFTSKDVMVYEEVALISGFQRPVVCLLGAPGIGRQTLRDMLIEADPDLYELALPYTSRPKLPGEVDGVEFFFESAAKMKNGYQKNLYIEFGESGGHSYGTKFKTLRRIAGSGRTCLLDCSPSAVNVIRTSEFMPYVVFLASPSVSCLKAMYEYGRSMGFTDVWKRDEDFRKTLDRSQDIERNYRHLFDKIFICDNIEVTFSLLREHLNKLLTEPQWVPAKWLY